MKKNNLSLGHGISEPIGLEYIESAVSRSGYSAILKNRFELVVTGNGLSHRVSLFSSTTSEWDKVLLLNESSKRNGNLTVVGGYHVTGLYHSNLLNDIPFDYVVVGEGEKTVLEVLNHIKQSEINEEVSFPQIFISEPEENINSFYFPQRHLRYLKKYKINDLMYPSSSKQINTAIVLGSRGCSNNCSFCASSAMWESKIRLRDIDNIIEELVFLKSKYLTNTVIFIDQCFGVKKAWTRKFCERMIRSDLKINWYIQTNISIDESLIPLMAEAGCSKIGFGVEGVSPKAAKIIKSGNKKSLDELNFLFKTCNNHGIITKAYLMLGFPWETKETIGEYFDWLPRLEVNNIKISYFTPFPGTRDWERYKSKIITENWGDFDTVKMAVVNNPEITPSEYIDIKTNLLHAFYNSEKYKKRSLEFIQMFPQLSNSYEEFFYFLKQYKMLPYNIKRNDWLSSKLEIT